MQNENNNITREFRAGFKKYVERIRSPEATAKRFWDKVDKRGPDECWVWKGAKYFGGYGSFNYLGKNQPAHRVSYILENGSVDPKKDVCHKCDNPPCCNPNHLFEGTVSENMKDAIQKGRKRFPNGERHRNAIFSDAQVIEIRRLFDSGQMTMPELVIKFGVKHHNIWQIVRRKGWIHLEPQVNTPTPARTNLADPNTAEFIAMSSFPTK